MDCTYQLFQIYKDKKECETALKYHEIFQTTSESLAKAGNEKALNMLKTEMEYDQQKQQLILENEKALAKRNIYIYTQKRLNLELRSNKADLEEKQACLNELNQTKNKLFSIIGHDLRGPIGAFQGLLKLFKEGEMTKDEFLDFVPKLKKASLKKICRFYLKSQSPKSIKLAIRIEGNCQIWSDPNQVDIIIRNLLSNALKFTPTNGEIIIGAIQKLKTCEIYVKDNGMGMTEETIGKIFQKDSTHTTYGTNDEKGTGLGLSLCKEMVEKNKGKIWVHSAIGKGSSFYFTMPRAMEPIKKSA
ncbi:unnamed protein product [Bathycoccus prasinos]